MEMVSLPMKDIVEIKREK